MWYRAVLLQEAVWSIMFWSYIPLVALGIIAAAFAVKMPIEVRFTSPTWFSSTDLRVMENTGGHHSAG